MPMPTSVGFCRFPFYPEIPDEAIEEVASEIENAFKLTTGPSRSQAVAEPTLNRI